MLFQLGYRFRVGLRGIPGTPDIAFPNRRKAIFVHGCFWHRHDGCPKCYTPKSRLEFWLDKFRRNVERDARTIRELEAAGWEALVVWECEAVDGERLRQRLIEFAGPIRTKPA